MLWTHLIAFSSILGLTLGEYNNECIMAPNSEKGHCMPVYSCKPTYELLQKAQADSEGESAEKYRKHLEQLKCGNFENMDHVCCAETDVQLNVASLNLLGKHKCGDVIKPADGKNCIAGGFEIALAGAPWMALLIYNDTDFPYKCGGSFISERYVLTSAHCITEDLYRVRLGEHRISTNPDCTICHNRCVPPAVDVDIDEAIRHPKYKSTRNDIGLIRLAQNIALQEHIQPICLPIPDEYRSKAYDSYFITGWGKTEKGIGSDVLLVAILPSVDRTECDTYLKGHGLRVSLTSEHICAGNRSKTDACRGDSGGPLIQKVTLDNRFPYMQFGVISFGMGYCGSADAPNVYTNVSHFLQWITDNMRD